MHPEVLPSFLLGLKDSEWFPVGGVGAALPAEELPKTKDFFNSESDLWQPNGANLIHLSGVSEVSPHGGVGWKSLYFHMHVKYING